jgi:hypothetical protein
MADSITTPVGANPPKEIDEFEIMRRRLQQRGAVRGAQAQRQGKRQAASLGNLPSGAAIKQQQLAQRDVERQTSEDVQNVNIVEAQTREREREAEAGRGLQRFGIETQAKTAETLANLQGEQAVEQLGIKGAQAIDLAKIGAANDIELAKLQGATQQDIIKLQGEINAKAAKVAEWGVNQRFSDTMSENRRMFNIESKLREKGLSMEKKMAEAGLDMDQQELAMNKSVTVLNSLGPLSDLGFGENEIGIMLDALDLPFADEIKDEYRTMVAERTAKAAAITAGNPVFGGDDN